MNSSFSLIKKKNIVIFSGGTGSQNLQRSIHKLCGNSVNVDIIISAYDNGKSTGEVRKVFDNSILGPSDLRKNQMLQYELIAPESEYKSYILEFMNYRFDADNSYDAYNICLEKINWLSDKLTPIIDNMHNDNDKIILNRILDEFPYYIESFFFESNLNFQKDLDTINFNDFSIANIIYSSIAAHSNNSLSKAGKFISDILGIPNNVHLISDVNLYLNAITKSGTIISDEGQIVDWNNSNDPIDYVILLKDDGSIYVPSVDEGNGYTVCSQLIRNADIIIFSSGTQWSSEIPTYMHKGFNDLIKSSNAKKYLIMNNTEDKDMKGINSAELLKIISNYVDLTDTTVIYNEFAEFTMRDQRDPEVSKLIKRSISGKLSNSADDKKHNMELFPFIMKDYYKEYLDSDLYVFDFDDTIYPRNASTEDIKIGMENLSLLNKCRKKSFILSGNSINRFRDIIKGIDKTIAKNIFSMLCVNGGNSIYKYDSNDGLVEKSKLFSYTFIKDNYFDLVNKLILIAKKMYINISPAQFENRGDVILSIKPIKGNKRESFCKQINNYFTDESIKLIAYCNGKTTIDIMPIDYTKVKCFEKIKENYYKHDEKVTYIGDELDNGNDASMKNSQYTKCLLVRNIYDTNLFLKVLNEK